MYSTNRTMWFPQKTKATVGRRCWIMVVMLLVISPGLRSLPLEEPTPNVRPAITCAINCLDFKRQIPVGTCAETLNDCGACMSGYMYHEDGYCVQTSSDKESSDLIANPPAIRYAVELGQNFTFNCHLDYEIDCAWLRAGFNVQIGDRYAYVNSQNGINTKDCSIQITDIRNIDLSNWQCGKMAESNSEGQMSKEVWLQQIHYIVHHPKNQSIELGDNVTMKCVLNTGVDCFWMRQGFHAEIRDRYRYISGQNGMNSSDCSIEISNISAIDLTYWQCGSMATSLDPGTLSYKVWLRENGFRVHPKSLTATVGDDVRLNCILEEAGDCYWFKNDNSVVLDDRHRYSSKGLNTTDCSLEINNVQERDTGNWQCGKTATQNRARSVSDIAELTVSKLEPSFDNVMNVFEDDDLEYGDILEDSDDIVPQLPRLVKRPMKTFVINGTTGILDCVFDTNVDCIWLRSGSVVPIEYRYKYMEGNGQNAKDCSIMITPVTMEDDGYWQCGCEVDEYPEGVFSQDIQLHTIIHRKYSEPERSSVDALLWVIIAVIAVVLISVTAVFIVLLKPECKSSDKWYYKVINISTKALKSEKINDMQEVPLVDETTVVVTN